MEGKKEQFVSITFHFIPFRWHEILINCQMSVMLTSCFMTESVNVTLRRLFALRTSGQVGVAGDWLFGGTLVERKGEGDEGSNYEGMRRNRDEGKGY